MEKKMRSPWIMVGTFMYCAMVSAFNETVLNVAYSTIAQDLGITIGTAQWLTTAFMLVTAVMVPVSGFLFLSIPTKRLFLLSIGIVLLGTVGCYFAPNFITLLIFRMVVSMGNGMLVPMMMNTTLIVAPRKHLGLAMALCACAITMGPAFAPVVAGFVMQVFSWRAIFLFMILLTGVGMAAGFVFIEDVATLTHPKVDVFSIFLSTLGLAGFLYGINTVFATPKTAVIYILVGVFFIGWFVLRQKKLPEPFLNLSPFSNRQFCVGLAAMCFAMLTNFSLSVLTPTYLQETLLVSSAVSGALLIPAVLLNIVSTSLSGKILDKKGVRVMLPAAFLVTAVGLVILGKTAPVLTVPVFLVLYVLIYQGLAFSLSPSQTTTLAVLPKELNAHGVSIVNTFIQVSASLGASMFGGIFATVQGNRLQEGADAAVASGAGYSVTIFSAVPLAVLGCVLTFVFFRNLKSVKGEEDHA